MGPPGLDECAFDGEVLVGEKSGVFGLIHDTREKFLRDLRAKKVLLILGEGGSYGNLEYVLQRDLARGIKLICWAVRR